jgi:hypothetical protein
MPTFNRILTLFSYILPSIAYTLAMASPNAHLALHLEAAPTYQRLPVHLRREWMTKVMSFPPN